MSGQDLLLRALWGSAPPEVSVVAEAGCRALPGLDLARGLQIYRENAKALSVRALAVAAPRLSAWLGDDFAGLAWAYARAHPPERGDAAEWGLDFPAFLATVPGMELLPIDLARLDLALHRLAGAPDEAAPPPSLWQRLSERPADALRLRLSAHLSVHHLPALAEPHAWQAAQVDLPASDEPQGPLEHWAGHVLVWRQGWRPAWGAVSPDGARWLEALAQAPSLAAALDFTLAEHPDFDLAGWLARAAGRDWCQDVV